MANKLVDSSSLIDIEEVANRFRKSDGSALVPSVDVLTVAGLRTKLLSWYRENRRMLPWRGDEVDGILAPAVSAYGIWVSEIMLQQTRVETVIPYWRRWMERFPTIEVLARATPDEVNALWAGLGYYRRAQQLLKGAQSVVSTFKGKIPDTAEDLKKIPGIGPYTAGAISSIAFGKTEPLVDGNVIRVLSRLFALQDVLGTSAMDKQCWSLAGTLVDPTSPGNFNQALMELGATVCKPTSPACEQCPVSMYCQAKALVEHQRQGSSKKKSHNTLLAYDLSEAESKDAESDAIDMKTNRFSSFSYEAENHLEGSSKEGISKKRKTSTKKGGGSKDEPSAKKTATEALDEVSNNESEELSADGLPLSVTYFPRKLPKNKPREVVLSVCVLASRDIDPEEDYYLFIRRPESGLLANQWEFPSMILWEEANSSAAAATKPSSGKSKSSAKIKAEKTGGATRAIRKSGECQVKAEKRAGEIEKDIDSDDDDDDDDNDFEAPELHRKKIKVSTNVAKSASNKKQSASATGDATLNLDSEVQCNPGMKPPDNIPACDLWKPFPHFLLDTMGVQWCGASSGSGISPAAAVPVESTAAVGTGRLRGGKASAHTKSLDGAVATSLTGNESRVRLFPIEGVEPPVEVIGPLVHVFSHQRHTMHVLYQQVRLQDKNDKSVGGRALSAAKAIKSKQRGSITHAEDSSHVDDVSSSSISIANLSWVSFCGGNRQVKWMSRAQLLEAGVTTACKKVLLSVAKFSK